MRLQRSNIDNKYINLFWMLVITLFFFFQLWIVKWFNLEKIYTFIFLQIPIPPSHTLDALCYMLIKRYKKDDSENIWNIFWNLNNWWNMSQLIKLKGNKQVRI